WIERKSRPTMTKAFADWLGAELVQDEDLFLSAVVSFGSFGLVHAVMFEAVPLFPLELYLPHVDYVDGPDAACTPAAPGLGLPDGDALPFHLEFVFNPYLRGPGQGGAFVRVLYKRVLAGPVPPPSPVDSFTILSQDLVGIAGHLTDVDPAIVPGFLQSQLL